VVHHLGASHPVAVGYEFDRTPPKYYDPASYAGNFRYIVDRVRAAGATNVATVWASTNNPLAKMTPTRFKAFYPGDEYVDWFGMSAFVPVLDPLMTQEARRRQKPMLLAESTPLGINIGEGRQFPLTTDKVAGKPVSADEMWRAWFGPTFKLIEENADVIAGLHYIANDWSQDKLWANNAAFAYCDARVWKNPEILRRWDATITAAPFHRNS
jgi:hypothetical protein